MQRVADFVNQLPEQRVNVIDVGCFTGSVTKDFAGMLHGKQVVSIGIDPIKHAPVFTFTYFEHVAIRNQPPAIVSFNNYDDPHCSSLLKLKDNRTTNPEERSTKWYADHEIGRVMEVLDVEVVPLSLLIEKYSLENETIHFLKIDAQGCDMEVVRSLGKYVSNCLFIQMETVISHNPNITLYEGQGLYEDEKSEMEALGFELFDIRDYSLEGKSPEADIVYKRKV